MSSNNGESLERWLRPLPFALLLAAGLFACFPMVLTGAESFFIRDYGVLGYPTIQFQRECFWRGELPLWNPYSNCGQPFLAQWGVMALYPFSLIYLLLPLPWSLSLFCFAHVWLGGFGMYLLVRHWTKVNFAAALAGTAYVFSGIMFAAFVWPNYLVTLGWMPLVVLLAERAWREGGRWLIGAVLVATLQMLSGVPELILFTWFIIGALWLADVARVPVSLLPFLRRIAFVVLLTSGLVAAQLLPFFELLHYSHRDVAFGTSKWQLPIWGWANFFVPLFNAFEPVANSQYYQYDQGFLSSVYLGNVAVVFALVALMRWPDVRVWILFLFCLVSVSLAFGDQTPVFNTVRKVLPFVGIGRYPVKFLFVLAFAIPLLAGFGMAAVMQGKRRGTIHAFALALLAIIAVIVWAARGGHFTDYSKWPENFRQNVSFSWNKPSPGKSLPDAINNTAWRAGLFIFGIAALSAAARGGKAAPLLAISGLALIAADARTHTPKQNPSIPSTLFTAHYWPQDLPKQLGQTRGLITPEDEARLLYLTSTNAVRLWEFQRRAEWSNLNLLDELAKVNGSSTLQTREQRTVEQALYSMTNRLPAALLDFLGVAYTSSNAQWIPRESSLPLITGGQQPVFVNDSLALAALTNNSFAPTQTVWLPENASGLVTITNSAPATVSSVRFTANAVEAEVNTTQSTLAVIAQCFYPAWKATVDGQDTVLLRANLAFQAVPVPAGKHRIRVFYSDAKFRAGAIISGACVLLCAVLWWRAARVRRFE